MSDNKKYYYLKLKENFYEQDHIKYIETMTHGYIYSNILLKLYLRSLKHEGCLRITESMPYDPGNIEPLAKVIGHDPSHVGEAINLAISLQIMKVVDMKEIWFTDIQNYIGKSSTEADRKRIHRKKLKEKEVGHLSANRPPELEIELEKEIDINKRKELPDNSWYGDYISYYNNKRNDVLGIIDTPRSEDVANIKSVADALSKNYELYCKIVDSFFTDSYFFTESGYYTKSLLTNLGSIKKAIDGGDKIIATEPEINIAGRE